MRAHRTDLFSLVLGVALVALGLAGFAGAVELHRIEQSALIPIALLAAAAAIVSTLRRATQLDEYQKD